jgi:hypothetical protein
MACLIALWAGSGPAEDRAQVSAPLENEAIGPAENEATQTDWLGDLSGGLGADPAAGGGRGSAAAGGQAAGYRQVYGSPGAGVGRAAEYERRPAATSFSPFEPQVDEHTAQVPGRYPGRCLSGSARARVARASRRLRRTRQHCPGVHRPARRCAQARQLLQGFRLVRCRGRDRDARTSLPRSAAHRNILAAQAGVSLADLNARMGLGGVRAAMIYQHAAAEPTRRWLTHSITGWQSPATLRRCPRSGLMARRGLGADHCLTICLVEPRVELRGLEP